MLIKSISRVVLASALIFAFSACSDDGGDGTDFDDSASSADTYDAAEMGMDFAEATMDQLNFGGPTGYLSASRAFVSLRPRSGSSRLSRGGLPADLAVPGMTAGADGKLKFVAAPGCSISSYGSDGEPWNPYDGNGNEIGDDWGLDQVCVYVDSSDAENHWTQRQTIKYRQKENTASLHGFTSSFYYENKWTSEEGDEEAGRFEAWEVVDIRAGSAHREVKYSDKEWDVEPGEPRYEWVRGAEMEADFDPADAIALDEDLPDGDLSFNGRVYEAETDSPSYSFDVETTEPLAYNAGCWDEGYDPPFTDGVIHGVLNGRNGSAEFTVTFFDCDGDYDIDVDNTSDEPAIASHRRPVDATVAVVPRRQ